MVVKEEYLKRYDFEKFYFMVSDEITKEYLISRKDNGNISGKLIVPGAHFIDKERLQRCFGRDVVLAYVQTLGHGDAFVVIAQKLQEADLLKQTKNLQVAFGEMATAVLPKNSNASLVTYLEALAGNYLAVSGGKFS